MPRPVPLMAVYPAFRMHGAGRLAAGFLLVAGAWIVVADHLLPRYFPDVGFVGVLQAIDAWLVAALASGLLLMVARESESEWRNDARAGDASEDDGDVRGARGETEETEETASAARMYDGGGTGSGADRSEMLDALDGVHVIVWECDADSWQFTFISDGIERVLGYAPEAWYEDSDLWVRTIHPEDRDRVVEACRAASDEGRDAVFEYRAIAADGRTVWLRDVVHVVLDDRGAARRLRGIMVDITERRHTEEALRKSEERYRSLLERVPVGVYRTTPDGRILEANSALVDMLGYPDRETLLGTRVDEIYVDSAERGGWRSEVERGGDAESFEYRNRRYDGSIIWVRDRSHVVRGEDGEVFYEGALEDITARKRAEEELRQHEAEFRALVENSPDIIVRFDREHRHLYISPTVERLTGRRPDEFIGKTNADLGMSSGLVDLWHEAIERVFEEGREQTIEFGYPASGGRRVLQSRLVPEVASDGRVATVLAVSRDITDRKRAEERLRLSERRFRSVVEESAEIITFVDPDGEIEYESAAVARVLGYSPEERVGRSAFDLVHPDDLPAIRRAFAELVETGEPRSVNMRCRHEDGSWRRLEARGTNLLHDPAVEAVVIHSRDVTDERLVQAQLQQAQKMEAVGRFASAIAHDFKNVLMTVDGYARLLLEEKPEEDGEREDLEEIVRAADRANELTRQLLAFGRKQTLQPTAQDPNAVVHDLEKMLKRLIGESIALELDLEQEIAAVRAAPGQLDQVLMNLAVNASDAMPGGGRLVIRTEVVQGSRAGAEPAAAADGGGRLVPNVPGRTAGALGTSGRRHVRLSVSDTGHGMDEETRTRIFEPFYTTKQDGRGTGLGLSTVYGIVRQLGGTIDVISEPGRGTTFSILLPAVERD